uniref:C3H1-type domain-containing protein n=1 Tax=Panagrolaimus superbus TaxID=310955 RepID=A0A914Z6A0_9BILA
MTDSDNGDYLSDDGEEIEAGMIEAESIEKDAISMQEGSLSRSSSPNSRPSSVTAAGRKSGTTDELVAGAEAISSDEEENVISDAEDGEVPQSSDSPKSPEEPPSKKQKPEPREDLEDGEIESDSEEEQEVVKEQQSPQPIYQQPQPLMSLPKPFITPPMMMRNNNRQFNNNRPKVDFPRQQNNYQNNQNNSNNKRKRPEDCGVCKFYLRGNCTWNDKCKYNHPLGGQRMQWLADLGLPDPEIGYNPNRPRKSGSPKEIHKRSPRVSRNNRRQNSEKSEPKKSPRASPISSDEESRSPSPKRIRQSPSAISISSDDSRPPSRPRTPRSLSPEANRRIRSSSSEGARSRSRSPFTSSRTTDTTLGALLRKRRLESQSKQSLDSNPSSFLPGNISDSDDEEAPAPPKNRAEAVRRFFRADPNEIPTIFQPSKMLSPPQSPTAISITSSEDERDRETLKSPSPLPRGGSESPVPI